MDMRRKALNPDADLALAPAALVKKSTIVYGIMISLGLAVVTFGHKTLPKPFAVPRDPLEALRLVAIGGLGAGLLLVLSYFFEDWFASFRELKAMITRYLGPLTAGMAVYLSVITAFGEELLFRGAMQPFAGLVLTSVLFGLLHMGQRGVVSAWSVWALVAGLLLGWIYEDTGSLWPPIIAHFGVNCWSILNLRRAYNGLKTHVAEAEDKASGDGPDA